MKTRTLILTATLCLAASAVFAAEKSKAQLQLETARSAVEAIAGKIADNREAAIDLELARTALKKGDEAADKGKQLFGFGGMKPEAELDIKRYAEIAELSAAAAAARIEKARATAELGVLDQQLESVKAKVKKFEDRRAELEKFKAEAARCQTAVTELETLKAENSRLNSQLEKQRAEIKALTTKLEEAQNEGVCRETSESTAPPKRDTGAAAPSAAAPAAGEAATAPAAPLTVAPAEKDSAPTKENP